MSNGEFVSSVERDFAIEAVRNGVRIDGRRPQDSRRVEVRLGPNYGRSEVTLGHTRAFSAVTVLPVVPRPQRNAEGILSFSVEISPAAAERYARQFGIGGVVGRTGEEAAEARSVVERVIRDSNAVDTEALCILAGKMVWKVLVDVVVVDHCGNAIDACVMAAMAALLHARRPEFTITGQDVVVHTEDEREPVPLAIQHVPFSVSFAVFADGELAAIDPVREEENAADGALTMSMNATGEVCGLHKAGGAPLDPKLVVQCASFAERRVVELSNLMKKAMEDEASHHPLATIQPILVAPDPAALLTKNEKFGDVTEGKDSGRKRERLRNISQWNAIPVYDDPPPTAPVDLEKTQMIADNSAGNGVSETMEIISDGNKSAIQETKGIRAKPLTKPTAKAEQGLESSSDSDSNDDLINAILLKQRNKQSGAEQAGQ